MVQTPESAPESAPPIEAAQPAAAEVPPQAANESSAVSDEQLAQEPAPEELSFDELLDRYFPSKALRRGEIIDGKVMRKGADGLLVNIGYKAEGMVPSKEMRSLGEEGVENIGVGDEVIAYVLNPEARDGSALLSIDRARGEQGWRILEKAMDSSETVKGVIIGSNRGGAVVESEGVQGFIPLSQLVGPARELYSPGGEAPKEGFLGMEVEFKIIELNRRRNRAIFSERSALQAFKQKAKMRLVEELSEGETRHGRVAGISNFGAFVDLGGADGLIHISELSWQPVRSPDEVLEVGQEIDVFILRVDRENLKIALSLRRLQPEPWETIDEKLHVGDVVKGKITKLANFGAFARIEGGIEGLIHISELSSQVIKHPREIVNEGDELDVRVIRIEPERRRLGFSLKQLPDEEYAAAREAKAQMDRGSFEQIFEQAQQE